MHLPAFTNGSKIKPKTKASFMVRRSVMLKFDNLGWDIMDALCSQSTMKTWI